MNRPLPVAAPWRRVLTAAALAAVLALFLAIPVGAAPAPPTPRAPANPVDLTLTGIAPEVMRVEDELSFSGSINNESDQPLEQITLWFRMQTLIPSDEGLTEWLAGRSENNVLTMARLDLPVAVAAGETARYTFPIPPESFPFDSGSDWGPRGVELVVVGTLTGTDTSEQVSASVRSSIFWLPDDADPASVTVIAALTPTHTDWATALAGRLPVSAVAAPRVAEVTEILGDRVDTWGLDAALLDPASIQSDPLGLLPDADAAGSGAAAGQTGDSAQESPPPAPAPTAGSESPAADEAPPATLSPELDSVLTRVASGPPVISLGWGRPDYPALLAAGANPDPPEAGRGGAELLAASQDRAGQLFADHGVVLDPATVWPGTTITGGVATRLPSEISAVITPVADSPLGIGPSGNSTYEVSGRVLGMHAPHAALSAQVVRPATDQAARAELLARAAIALRATPTGPLLLALPADLTADDATHAARNLDLVREAFDRSPFTHQVESAANPITGPQPAGLLSPEDVTTLAGVVATARDFGPLLVDTDAFTPPVSAAVFTALSTTWREEPEPRDQLIAELAEMADRLDEALTIEIPSTVNLISSGSELPVSVSSAVPVALNARVELRPGDPRVQTGAAIEATFEPGRTTSVPVPITAVGNGNIPMTIHVLAGDGSDIAHPQTFTMRVRADWETTGTAVLAGLVLIGFVFGLYRNISGKRAPKKGGHPRG